MGKSSQEHRISTSTKVLAAIVAMIFILATGFSTAARLGAKAAAKQAPKQAAKELPELAAKEIPEQVAKQGQIDKWREIRVLRIVSRNRNLTKQAR